VSKAVDSTGGEGKHQIRAVVIAKQNDLLRKGKTMKRMDTGYTDDTHKGEETPKCDPVTL